MSYSYGGKMNKKTKERCLQGFLAFTLMLSIFSDMSPTLAHHHYHYRLPDGTVTCMCHHHRHGWGDFDDFAFWSDHWGVIPVKDSKDDYNPSVRNSLKKIVDITGNRNESIKDLVKDMRKISEERLKTQSDHRKLDALNLVELFKMKKGDFKSLFNDLRNPENLLQAIDSSMKNKLSSVNPNLPEFGGLQTIYTMKEINEGVRGKIMRDKINYALKNNQDSINTYAEHLNKKDEFDKKIDIISKGSKSGSGSSSGNSESQISLSEQKEAIMRQRMVLKDLRTKTQGAENRRLDDLAYLEDSRHAIHNSQARSMMHFPTSKELKNDMPDKYKLSESKDLGFIRFGTDKKANFNSILKDAIEPPTDENGKFKAEEKANIKDAKSKKT